MEEDDEREEGERENDTVMEEEGEEKEKEKEKQGEKNGEENEEEAEVEIGVCELVILQNWMKKKYESIMNEDDRYELSLSDSHSSLISFLTFCVIRVKQILSSYGNDSRAISIQNYRNGQLQIVKEVMCDIEDVLDEMGVEIQITKEGGAELSDEEIQTPPEEEIVGRKRSRRGRRGM